MSSEKKEYMEIDICKGPIIDRLEENFWVKEKVICIQTELISFC